MKLIDARTVNRLAAKCAVLLALATFPMPGQSVPAKATHGVPGSPAKTAARLHRTRAMPEAMPLEPVALAPLTPEQLPAEPPHVIDENGQLTIDSHNSTLRDVLNAISRQIGAQLDMPPEAAKERVAVHLSGSAHQAISALLDGSSLNYIIMGSPGNPDNVQKIILTKQLPASGVQKQQPVAANAPAITQSPVIASVLPVPQPAASPQFFVRKPFPADDDFEPPPAAETPNQVPPLEQTPFQAPDVAPLVLSVPAIQPVPSPPIVRKPFPADDDFDSPP
jgi:hypothetical protein